MPDNCIWSVSLQLGSAECLLQLYLLPFISHNHPTPASYLHLQKRGCQKKVFSTWVNSKYSSVSLQSELLHNKQPSCMGFSAVQSYHVLSPICGSVTWKHLSSPAADNRETPSMAGPPPPVPRPPFSSPVGNFWRSIMKYRKKTSPPLK